MNDELQLENSQKRFEVENKIKILDSNHEFFKHNKEEQREILRKAPWKQDPNYFERVHISAVALVKMIMHARSGGDIEVMGSLQGRVRGKEMIIMDSFELPVEGTETRVSAANEGYEYMVQYMTQAEQAGRQENAIGWYHSHPGYGCWLSGIDVGTQKLNQTYSEPFLAIVVDPKRTISAGKVELGAFRTYPESYKPPAADTESQSIPLEKIEDFGAHANSYYQIPVSYFKSSLDTDLLKLLWKRYWINTFSSSPLVANWGYISNQMKDLSGKIEGAQSKLHSGFGGGGGGGGDIRSKAPASRSVGSGLAPRKKTANPGEEGSGDTTTSFPLKKESALSKVVGESVHISSEATHGLLSQVVKNILFNTEIN